MHKYSPFSVVFQRLLTSAALVLLLVLPHKICRAQSLDADTTVVAEINGSPIFSQDLDAVLHIYLGQLTANNLTYDKRIMRNQALHYLIDQRLLYAAAKSQSLVPDKKAIRSHIKNKIAVLDFNKKQKETLAIQGMTLKQLEDQVCKKLAIDAYLQQAVYNKTLSEQVLRTIFENSIDFFTPPVEVKTRHIMLSITPTMTEEEIKAQRQKAETIRDLALNPDLQFESLAKKHSESANFSKSGNLGYFTRNQFENFQCEQIQCKHTLSDTVFAMQIDEISNVIKTSKGFHIIKLEDRRGGNPPRFEDVKSKVISFATKQQQKFALSKHLNTLRHQAKIIIYIN